MSILFADQEIEPAITKILEGIKEFKSAAQARKESKDWTDSHIDDLIKIEKQLLDIDLSLRRIH